MGTGWERVGWSWRAGGLRALLQTNTHDPTCTHPQGRGLGRYMLQLLELGARKAGVPRLMLTVLHGNTGAHALYRALG